MSKSTEEKIDAKANQKLGTYRGPGASGSNAKRATGKTKAWTGK